MVTATDGPTTLALAELLQLAKDNANSLGTLRQEVGSIAQLVMETRADVSLQNRELILHNERITALDARIDVISARCAERLARCQQERTEPARRSAQDAITTVRLTAEDVAAAKVAEATAPDFSAFDKTDCHVMNRPWRNLRLGMKCGAGAAGVLLGGLGLGSIIWAVSQLTCLGG